MKWAALIAFAAVAVYGRTATYGLFSDDYNWLVGAQMFDAGSLFDLSHRTHFFRPVVELYFRVALSACGRSAECYHWLNIALHAGTSILVAGLIGSISKTRAVGLLAGVLFAVTPAPIEAVLWVAAVPEVLGACLYVAAIWLIRRAMMSAEWWTYGAGACAFVACLLTHESGATLLPVLALSIWMAPPDGSEGRSTARAVRMLLPLVVVLTVYLVISYVINSRNYLVIEGEYGLGTHVLTNALRALATFAITRHDTVWLLVLGGLTLWAVLAGTSRIRLYALCTLIMLAPVVGFRGGVASRYLYLPAVAFAALIAETLWWARGKLQRWPRVGEVAWWALTIAVTLRCAAFAVKNVGVWREASAPFTTYAAQVRQLYPAPTHGATLDVPPPPAVVAPQYVDSLLQWEYKDPTLKVVVRER